MIAGSRAEQIRGTQTLVDQMGWMLRHPSVVAAEVGWRGCSGSISAGLLVATAHILTVLTPEESGLSNIDLRTRGSRRGLSVARLAKYDPLIAHELRWLLPIAAVAWIVVSGLGRSFVFRPWSPGCDFVRWR